MNTRDRRQDHDIDAVLSLIERRALPIGQLDLLEERTLPSPVHSAAMRATVFPG